MAKAKEPKEPKDATVVKEPVAAPAPEKKPSTPPKVRVPKLEKKNKSRLPRKEKKAQLKAANRKSGGK
jgi:hypothetical protein